MATDVWSRLEELKKSGDVEVSMQFSAAGVYVSIAAKDGNDEDFWGNYYDDVEEGLEDCLNRIAKLAFHRNIKRHNLEVVK